MCFWLAHFSAPARAKPMVYTTRGGLLFGLGRDRSATLGVRLLRPSRCLVLYKCLSFGRNETDASLQACVYSGHIVASLRVKRFSLRSTRDRRIAPGVRLPRPNRGPVPRQAVFLFGQLETDASLQACAYSGRIVALPRVKRFFSSINSRPTHRSRRALTPAESWPFPASSGFSLRSRQ
jgi:hypothetical protein